MVNAATHVGVLAPASLIAVLALSASAGFASAAPVNTARAACEAQGYMWDSARGCANKKCMHNGKVYEPGATIKMGKNFYFCDGFFGGWSQVLRPVPPKAVLPSNPTPSTQ